MNPFACVLMPFTKQLDLDILPFPLLSPLPLWFPLVLFPFLFLSSLVSSISHPFSSPHPFHFMFFFLSSYFFFSPVPLSLSSLVSSHLTFPLSPTPFLSFFPVSSVLSCLSAFLPPRFSLPPPSPPLPSPVLSCPSTRLAVITADSEISSFFIESVNDMWHSQWF